MQVRKEDAQLYFHGQLAISTQNLKKILLKNYVNPSTNSVKLQDAKSLYRNQLHFYTQIISSKKKEIRNVSLKIVSKTKIPRNKFKQQ